MSAGSDEQLQARREAIVREHMESENVHDFDTTIGTFSHPRYEIVPTGDVYDGEAAVRAYFAETRRAFPDQRNELVSLRHADDAVIVEFDLLGTQRGPLRSLPPTGRSFRARMTAFFIFEGDRIVCERVYFDQATILRQLGVARDPTSLAGRITTALSHPVTIGGALVKGVASRARR
ncbi:MAG TPA: ester cyclase [Solirubrobacteraceae bacterium]